MEEQDYWDQGYDDGWDSALNAVIHRAGVMYALDKAMQDRVKWVVEKVRQG